MLLGATLFFVACVWSLAFPVNKKLWTSSFALLTISFDLMILGILLAFLPKGNRLPWWGRFFATAGKNPLAIYLLSQLLLTALFILPVGNTSVWEIIYNSAFVWMGAHLGSLTMALVYALFCWSVGYLMERKKVYWNV